jgi:hypothetical protein
LFLQGKIVFFQRFSMFDLSGWSSGFWLMVVIDIAAVAVLGLAIVCGNRMWRNRPKDRATVRASDEATRRLYHPNESSGDKRDCSDKLRKHVERLTRRGGDARGIRNLHRSPMKERALSPTTEKPHFAGVLRQIARS